MEKKFCQIIMVLFGATIVTVLQKQKYIKVIKEYSKKSEKDKLTTQLVIQLLRKKREGFDLEAYLQQSGYRRIAVYGLNDFGKAIVEELNGGKVNIVYGIDNGAMVAKYDFPIYTSKDGLEPVDAVLVTPVFYFDEIKKELSKKLECPVISLGEVLFE